VAQSAARARAPRARPPRPTPDFNSPDATFEEPAEAERE
jgi:hypothetical protein